MPFSLPKLSLDLQANPTTQVVSDATTATTA